jgi:SAM-dependent methyltransferase
VSVNQRIVKQFKQPHGLIGQLAGYIMANRPSNIERNEWTLELLSLEPEDRLLEIGFGPGIAIAKASEIITNGLIFGIDHSETMLRQAHKRNLAAIQRKRVQLQLGTVDSIPRFDRPFNKVFSANVVQFWADPQPPICLDMAMLPLQARWKKLKKSLSIWTLLDLPQLELSKNHYYQSLLFLWSRSMNELLDVVYSSKSIMKE